MKDMKIVVLDGYVAAGDDLSWDALAELGELTVYDRTGPDEVLSRCEGATAVITNKVVMSAEIIGQLPQLKYIECSPRDITMWISTLPARPV